MTTPPGRRTKIVCTLGPNSATEPVVAAMIEAGMDVARINFSHGSREFHEKTAGIVRECSSTAGKAVAIMADLQGPKIRTGPLRDGKPVALETGAAFRLTTERITGTASRVSTTYDRLPQDVRPGDTVFLADGLLELRVERIDPPDVHCTVTHGGMLGEYKGINLPGVDVSAPTLSEKDIEDIGFAVELGVDFIAQSFVRSADDVRQLKARIKAFGGSAAVVAKIERPEAVHNLSGILRAAEAIMLARGDLGVEVPLNEIPLIQKRLIRECNDQGVPVITATQMLESMTEHVRPTRAEVTDVANAIYDGSDALMLSAETATGRFPVRAVEVMERIAHETDQALVENPTYERIERMRESGIRRGRGAFGDAIAQAACRTAHALGARGIICFTKRASTAALVARYRPEVRVTALTLTDDARYRCAVIWGVTAIQSIEPVDTDELDKLVDALVLEHNLAEPGDTLIIAGGIPLAMRTRTNMLKLHRVKKIR